MGLFCFFFIISLFSFLLNHLKNVTLPIDLNCAPILLQICFCFITRTCLYYVEPLKPLLYCTTGVYRVYIIFLISAQKHRLWVLVTTASPRRFYREPTIYVFAHKYDKISEYFSEYFLILVVKFSVYLNRLVFVML